MKRGVVFLFFASFFLNPVYAFFSLHQLPLEISKSWNEATQSYPKHTPLRSFKKQYNPISDSQQGGDPVAACQIGTAINNECAFPSPGILALPSQPYYSFLETEFRIYLPKGTKEFFLLGYYAQGVEGAYALRFREKPVSRTLPTEKTYAQLVAERQWMDGLKKLDEGQELIVAHENGGTIFFSAGTRATPLETGGWVYIRHIHGQLAAAVGGSLKVDLDLYKQAYANMQWDRFGDPVEAGVAPAFSITASPASLTNGGTLIVTAQNGTLKSCTARVSNQEFTISVNATDKSKASAEINVSPKPAPDTKGTVICINEADNREASATFTLVPEPDITLTGRPTLVNNWLKFPLTFTAPKADSGPIDVYLVTALTDPANSTDQHYFIQGTDKYWRVLDPGTLDTAPPTSRQAVLATSGNTVLDPLEEVIDGRTEFMLRLFNPKFLLAYRLKDDNRTPFLSTLRLSPAVDLLPALPATRSHFALPQLDYPPVDSVTLGRAVFGERFIGR
jgi:hypothetical protein